MIGKLAALLVMTFPLSFVSNGNLTLSAPPGSVQKAQSSVDSLVQVANDRNCCRSQRAGAIFALFRLHIRPGDTVTSVNRVLGEAPWLNESDLYYFGMLGGWIPIDINPKDRTYSLHLFPDDDGNSDYVIYFQLAGNSNSGKYKKEGFEFLRGKPGPKGESSSLHEFALCTPNGRIEVFRINKPKER